MPTTGVSYSMRMMNQADQAGQGAMSEPLVRQMVQDLEGLMSWRMQNMGGGSAGETTQQIQGLQGQINVMKDAFNQNDKDIKKALEDHDKKLKQSMEAAVRRIDEALSGAQ